MAAQAHEVDLDPHSSQARLVTLPCGCRFVLTVVPIPASLPDEMVAAILAALGVRLDSPERPTAGGVH